PTLRVLLNSALSSGSRKLYQGAWAFFNDFYQQFYHSVSLALPLTTPVLALFVSYLHARKLAPSTIKSYLSAIGYVHKLKGLRDPTRAFIIDKLFTALGRQGSSDIRLPISSPFKHNTDKRPFVILIEREDSMPFCPVQAMFNYPSRPSTQAGHLFCHSDTSPITVGQ
ncbi:unnamed protein product, partial [Porites evermanni]